MPLMLVAIGVTIEVRRARPDEIGPCAALYEEVALEIFTWIDPAHIQAQDIIDDAREEEVYVALDDGRLVGFASAYTATGFLHSLYIAAADLICGEAGALATDHRGRAFVYNDPNPRAPSLICAAPGCCDGCACTSMGKSKNAHNNFFIPIAIRPQF